MRYSLFMILFALFFLGCADNLMTDQNKLVDLEERRQIAGDWALENVPGLEEALAVEAAGKGASSSVNFITLHPATVAPAGCTWDYFVVHTNGSTWTRGMLETCGSKNRIQEGLSLTGYFAGAVVGFKVKSPLMSFCAGFSIEDPVNGFVSFQGCTGSDEMTIVLPRLPLSFVWRHGDFVVRGQISADQSELEVNLAFKSVFAARLVLKNSMVATCIGSSEALVYADAYNADGYRTGVIDVYAMPTRRREGATMALPSTPTYARMQVQIVQNGISEPVRSYLTTTFDTSIDWDNKIVFYPIFDCSSGGGIG